MQNFPLLCSKAPCCTKTASGMQTCMCASRDIFLIITSVRQQKHQAQSTTRNTTFPMHFLGRKLPPLLFPSVPRLPTLHREKATFPLSTIRSSISHIHKKHSPPNSTHTHLTKPAIRRNHVQRNHQRTKRKQSTLHSPQATPTLPLLHASPGPSTLAISDIDSFSTSSCSDGGFMLGIWFVVLYCTVL